ncbi:MAG TPA: hypothetical protein PK992_09460, partial [Planctomycetaceae bacterium]|nr:hypothetical protein [Planctomycetaceae bacterium]
QMSEFSRIRLQKSLTALPFPQESVVSYGAESADGRDEPFLRQLPCRMQRFSVAILPQMLPFRHAKL